MGKVKKNKGLSDKELAEKYETGKPFDLDKQLKPLIRKKKDSKK